MHRISAILCEYLFNSDFIADEAEKATERYLWHRCDYDRLSEALRRIDWELEFMYLPVNLAFEVFLSLLNDLIGIYVPTCSIHKRIPWSVIPPNALKSARSGAWKTYKELELGLAGLMVLLMLL